MTAIISIGCMSHGSCHDFGAKQYSELPGELYTSTNYDIEQNGIVGRHNLKQSLPRTALMNQFS